MQHPEIYVRPMPAGPRHELLEWQGSNDQPWGRLTVAPFRLRRDTTGCSRFFGGEILSANLQGTVKAQIRRRLDGFSVEQGFGGLLVVRGRLMRSRIK